MSNMTKVVVAVLLLAVVAFGLIAQTDSEERDVPAFSKLRVNRGIDVRLTQSDRQHLRVDVDGVDLDDVVTEVRGDELRISRAGFGNLLGRGGGVTVDVEFVRLDEIEASGGSDIEGRNAIRAEALTVEVSGGSDVDLTVEDVHQLDFTASGGSDLRLRGTARALTIDASGGSDVAARGLEARRANVRVSGGSDAAVHVTEEIDIEANGGSDVEVYGDPGTRTVDTDRSSDVSWK